MPSTFVQILVGFAMTALPIAVTVGLLYGLIRTIRDAPADREEPRKHAGAASECTPASPAGGSHS